MRFLNKLTMGTIKLDSIFFNPKNILTWHDTLALKTIEGSK